MAGDSPRLRLSILGIVALSLFTALIARLWYLQVIGTEEYQLAAEVQNTRQIEIEAPRGRILDAQGRVIVDNRISTVVTLDPDRLDDVDEPEQEQQLLDLAEELTLFGQPTKVADLRDTMADPQYNPVEPVPVASDVSSELENFLLERRDEFPAVDVRRESVRTYPYGQTAAHILGYVGRISLDEFDDRMAGVEPGDVPKPYESDDSIGKAGVELSYEDDLRGVPGTRTIEVDARGEPIRTLEYSPPVPGSDIQLTIDLDVQVLTERALLEGLAQARARAPRASNPQNGAPAGSIVVEDPRNGALVAMASYPTYSPDEFVGGISGARYDELLGDEASSDPFTNRAIAGQYAPGSTFKLVTAYAAMTNGLIAENSSYFDRGSYTALGCETGVEGCTFSNAGDAVYGSVNVQRALTVSSDVFFYWLGDRFWVDEGVVNTGIQDAGEAFGLNSPTGVPLPFEQSGYMPTEARRQERNQENPEAFPFGEWYSGDNIITAIGQGDVLVTPLQLTNTYASLVNRGTVYQPGIVSRILEPGSDPTDPAAVARVVEPVVKRQLSISDEIWIPMYNGFLGVTSASGGTARRVFEGWDQTNWPVGGKTGTAEVNGKADTSVYVGFGPANDPRYVVGAILEESGFGSDSAAPAVRWILEPLSGQVEMPRAVPLAEGGGVVAEPCPEVEPDPSTSTTSSTTTSTTINPLIGERVCPGDEPPENPGEGG